MDERKSYIMQISFWQPSAGPVRVLAKDEAHAKELLPKLLPGVRDIEVHDVSLETELTQPDPEDNTPSETPVTVN